MPRNSYGTKKIVALIHHIAYALRKKAILSGKRLPACQGLMPEAYRSNTALAFGVFTRSGGLHEFTFGCGQKQTDPSLRRLRNDGKPYIKCLQLHSTQQLSRQSVSVRIRMGALLPSRNSVKGQGQGKKTPAPVANAYALHFHNDDLADRSEQARDVVVIVVVKRTLTCSEIMEHKQVHDLELPKEETERLLDLCASEDPVPSPKRRRVRRPREPETDDESEYDSVTDEEVVEDDVAVEAVIRTPLETDSDSSVHSETEERSDILAHSAPPSPVRTPTRTRYRTRTPVHSPVPAPALRTPPRTPVRVQVTPRMEVDEEEQEVSPRVKRGRLSPTVAAAPAPAPVGLAPRSGATSPAAGSPTPATSWGLPNTWAAVPMCSRCGCAAATRDGDCEDCVSAFLLLEPVACTRAASVHTELLLFAQQDVATHVLPFETTGAPLVAPHPPAPHPMVSVKRSVPQGMPPCQWALDWPLEQLVPEWAAMEVDAAPWGSAPWGSARGDSSLRMLESLIAEGGYEAL